MSGITDFILNFLTNFANSVSLPLFVIVGALTEEVLAVIPSPFVPLTAGSLAYNQGKSVYFILFLVLIGAIAKTFSTSVVFWFSDKLEDLITKGKLGKILGLEANEIERYGKIFSKNKSNIFIVFILRALPFIPTLPVTVVSGLIKVKYRIFALGTFLGVLVRNSFYLLGAFYGLQKFQSLVEGVDALSSIFEILMIIGFLGFIFFLLRNNWERIFMALKKRKKK
ncbi:MAG TPA: VTT domain-containing protein [Candidatus Woesebacteria bacterium]|nr:VTT domain-containing protein [Candidatus Woesebacteria bacterium]